MIAEGPDYLGSVLGPMRMRYVGVDGKSARSPSSGRDRSTTTRGTRLVIPEVSVVDALGDAVQAIAHHEPIERAVELIAESFRVYPMIGDCCVLRVVDDLLLPMTRWPLANAWWSQARDAPWHVAARSGVNVDVNDVAELSGARSAPSSKPPTTGRCGAAR